MSAVVPKCFGASPTLTPIRRSTPSRSSLVAHARKNREGLFDFVFAASTFLSAGQAFASEVSKAATTAVAHPAFDLTPLFDFAATPAGQDVPLILAGVGGFAVGLAAMITSVTKSQVQSESGKNARVEGASATLVNDMLERDSKTVFVDIRSPSNVVEAGSPLFNGIKGKSNYVPFTIDSKGDKMMPTFGGDFIKLEEVDEDSNIVLFDSDGSHAPKAAAEILKVRNLKKVQYVEGGAKEWKSAALDWKEPGETPTATKATPTATKATPTATKATPTATKATPTATKEKPTATKATPTATKEEPTSSKAALEGVERILHNNRNWAKKVSAGDPNFFPEMSKGQTPEFLWIGCADSRVDPNIATGSHPGDVFTHRNVGNVVLHTDMNCMSALEYSVLALKVKHVIVCGHTNCGAVNASLTLPQKSDGVVNCWIAHIRDVRNEYAAELKKLTPEEQLPFMCEANALRQAFNVCTAPAIQSAWASGQEVYVHALLFDLATGKLKRLAGPISSLEQAAAAESNLSKGIMGSKMSKGLANVYAFESAM